MTEYRRLDELCHINMGQSPDSKNYNEYAEGLPFFQGNADFGVIYPTARVWCSSPTKVVEPGTLLISVRAPIGALNFAKERSCIGRGLAGITPHHGISTKFIYYALKGKYKELNAKGTGSTFKAIAKNALGETLVKVASKAEQMEIVQTLDKVSGAIEARKQQLQTLDELAKARFVEMFGDEARMDRWPCCRIGDVAEVSVGVVIKPAQYYTDDSDNGIPAFRSLNIGEMYIKDNNWVYFTPEGNAKNKKSILRENDLAIVRSGAPGTACVITEQYSDFNAIDIIIARPNTEKINPVFLCAFTNYPHGKKQIKAGTGGAAQQHFNVGKYKEMTLIKPPMPLQEEFAAFVAQTDKSKVAVQQALDKTQKLFDSLMQQYFS